MTREEIIDGLEIYTAGRLNKDRVHITVKELQKFIDEIKALGQELCKDKGEASDGYHTFNQLYHQRAILFATIVNQNKDISWKSYKHSDGKYCFDSNGEWFIVGVDTPEGSYTYHYSKEYWGYFECKELDCGKEWDGHTEEDVTRLLSLKKEPCDDWCDVPSDEMTLEQAREFLQDRIRFIDGNYPEAIGYKQALKTAVRELGKQQCEDCISRQDALNCLTATGLKKFDFILDARNKIKNLPSVTPQQKVGHSFPEGATNKDIFKAIFGYEPATDSVVCNKEDWCGASEPCNYCINNSNNIGREEDWWNAPYKKAESEDKE